MSTERLCPDGHVVENGRETCARCNGPVVNQNNDVDLGSEESNTTMPEDVENEAVEDTAVDSAESSENTESADVENSESADSAEDSASESSEASADSSEESSEEAAPESSESSESSEE